MHGLEEQAPYTARPAPDAARTQAHGAALPGASDLPPEPPSRALEDLAAKASTQPAAALEARLAQHACGIAPLLGAPQVHALAHAPADDLVCCEDSVGAGADGELAGLEGGGSAAAAGAPLDSGLLSAAAGGCEANGCAAGGGVPMGNLLSALAAQPEPRINLGAGLLPGLGGDEGWDLAGAKGGLNYAVADADLLTHMVPKTPPRKKCVACQQLNPTARQSCLSCGAKFQMRPKRSATGTPSEEHAGAGSRHKREAAPAAEGAPASSKLRAPRKKCAACDAFNPTAQQACQACGARFTIKSKAKAQSKASKDKEAHGGALGGLQLPLGTPLALGALTSAIAASGMRLPGALGSAERQAQLLGTAGLRAQGPHVTLGADGRLQFHDAPSANGAQLDLQAILQASSSLNSAGAPIGEGAGAALAGRPPGPGWGALALAQSLAPADGSQCFPAFPPSDMFTGSEVGFAGGRLPEAVAASNSGPSMSSAPFGGVENGELN